MLRRLEAARHTASHGLALPDLAAALRSDPLALEPLLDLLVELDWAARLDEDGTPRHVLLCDPALTRSAAAGGRAAAGAGRRHTSVPAARRDSAR